MKKLTLIPAILIATTLSANAQVNDLKHTRVKVNNMMDGLVRTCSSKEDISLNKRVQMAAADGIITVRLVKCAQNNRGGADLSLDSKPTRTSYKADNGDQVVVSYSNYELVTVDKQSNILDVQPLKTLESAGQESVAVTDAIAGGYEVFLRATAKLDTAQGIHDQYQQVWGSFVLQPQE